MRFFRLQDAGIGFDEMCDFVSADGGDGMEAEGGLCVSGRLDKFGGAEGAYGPGRPAEIVILTGRILAEIYDGYRIEPRTEVTRFGWEAWKIMLADGSAWDWE